MLFKTTIFKYETSTIRISQKKDNCNENKVLVIGYLAVIIKTSRLKNYLYTLYS